MDLRITLLSNGHGEDVIGSQLVKELQKQLPTASISAFPTVDEGQAYEPLDIPILGTRQVMPSGGFLFHSFDFFVQDIRAGFVQMTFRQLRQLRTLETDILIVVGDIYVLLLSQLVKCKKRIYLQPLVSAYHLGDKPKPNRYFMERYSRLERILIKRSVSRMYVRDKATECHLKTLGIENVTSFGNPMMDAVKDFNKIELNLTSPVIAFLPGTRHHARDSLMLMLESLEHLPNATGLVAWAGGDLPKTFADWKIQKSLDVEGLVLTLALEKKNVYIFKQRFSDVLHAADMVLGTAGTANEQAASLGLPIVAFPVKPLYTTAFLANQKRLLGDALTVTNADSQMITREIKALLNDSQRRERAARIGRERMGGTGATKAVIADILSLNELQSFEVES